MVDVSEACQTGPLAFKNPFKKAGYRKALSPIREKMGCVGYQTQDTHPSAFNDDQRWACPRVSSLDCFLIYNIKNLQLW